MDRQKVIGDTILAAQDTMCVLQMWLSLLEGWRESDQAEPDDFMDACQQLKDANLWQWVNQAGGHGIEALSQAVGLAGNEVNDRYGW